MCLSVCHFVLVFFSPFSIAITSLKEKSMLQPDITVLIVSGRPDLRRTFKK